FKYASTTHNIEPVGDSPPVTQGLINYGQWTYRGLCIGCHGREADGNGAVWELSDKWGQGHALPRKPRDFTAAVFKVRSTPSGSLPTDRDLFMAISRGLVADQDMPAFKFLPERDRWAVISYIKTLSPVWVEEAEYQDDPIEVGDPPMPTDELVAAGKDVYHEMKCAKCHGEKGKGDGPSAPELEDDNGLSIKPRDFSDASQFVAGNSPRGVYQTFTTGFDGTPMPSFADFLDEDQRWQLVWYVMSLRNGWDLEKAQEAFSAEQQASSS
ncbi:MAG TPA: c-type cytochrome, partial [Gammaproteobacteria bacterium]|nr:c-type cytochrome [Gammaproteobacteria bacterium]